MHGLLDRIGLRNALEGYAWLDSSARCVLRPTHACDEAPQGHTLPAPFAKLRLHAFNPLSPIHTYHPGPSRRPRAAIGANSIDSRPMECRSTQGWAPVGRRVVGLKGMDMPKSNRRLHMCDAVYNTHIRTPPFASITQARQGAANMELASASAFAEEGFDAREWVEAVLAASAGASGVHA